MNKLNRKIPFQYAVENLKDLNWNDILFLLNLGYLEYEAAIEHAKEVIGSISEQEKLLVELIVLSPMEVKEGVLVKEYVAKLANNADEQKICERAMFLILSWLYDSKGRFEDLMDAIWSVAEDFNYYPSLADLYRPYDEPGVIYQDWEKYLRGEARRWGV